MKTPMKHCYSKSYSPESSLDYERQVMLQRCFVVVFAVSEFVGICITAIGRRVCFASKVAQKTHEILTRAFTRLKF